MKYTFSLPPTTNSAYANRRSGGRILTEDARAWKQEAGWIVKSSGDAFNLAAKYILDIELYVTRDRDIDGSNKLLLDALSGIVYEDDSQVLVMRVYKFVKAPGQAPRIDLEISEAFPAPPGRSPQGSRSGVKPQQQADKSRRQSRVKAP